MTGPEASTQVLLRMTVLQFLSCAWNEGGSVGRLREGGRKHTEKPPIGLQDS